MVRTRDNKPDTIGITEVKNKNNPQNPLFLYIIYISIFWLVYMSGLFNFVTLLAQGGPRTLYMKSSNLSFNCCFLPLAIEVKQERIDHDIQQVKELYKACKIQLDTTSIKKTGGLGKFNNEKRDRPLLVTQLSLLPF
jgi:hypothetical protein